MPQDVSWLSVLILLTCTVTHNQPIVFGCVFSRRSNSVRDESINAVSGMLSLKGSSHSSSLTSDVTDVNKPAHWLIWHLASSSR